MGDSSRIDLAETAWATGPGTAQLVEQPPAGGERYADEGTLGQGGMGVVSLHLDRRIGRRVAAKQLRPELAADAVSRARFLREAQVQGQLEHPAIPPVYDLGERPDGAPYFTMRTLRGVTLRDILAAMRAGDTAMIAKHPPRRLLAGLASVCLAIEYAHERGILHRDLKPANLMFGDYGEVYVLDWGIAKIQGESDAGLSTDADAPTPNAMTHVGAVLGTPGYMSPEQLDDARGVGPGADVYALGAILFEILTLTPLHPRNSVRETMEATRTGVDARPSVRAPDRDVAPELETACVAATQVDPAARLPTARALHDLVQGFLEGERDLELRRQRSAEHAAAATRALEQVRADADALDARRKTMQEVGRALALDADNREAAAAMAELFATPPRTPPPEIAFVMERGLRRRSRWLGGVGVAVYTSVLGFLPIFLWMGVRQPILVGAFFALLGVSVVLSALVRTSKVPPVPIIMASMLASSAAFAVAARFGSPLVLMPTALAVNASGYAIFLGGWKRIAVAATACGTFVLMVGLELTGVLSPTFEFRDGGLVILPAALSMPATATTILVVGATLASMVIGSLIVGYLRDQLEVAEKRIYLYAWHLRELVPDEARKVTDHQA